MDHIKIQEDHQMELRAMKSLLADTDYIINKIVESMIEAISSATAVDFVVRFLLWLNAATTEYGPVVQNRTRWRRRIQELEAQLAASEANP